MSPNPFCLLPKMPKSLLSVLIASLATWFYPIAVAQEAQSLIEVQRALRKDFQSLELITSRQGSWIFPLASPPKIVWRELAAKAMEIKTGKCAARIYHEYLFEPLGLQDIIMGNASSDGEFTAMELGVVGQWLANRGSYGEYEFISPETFEELLPKTTDEPTVAGEHGLGLHRIRHRRPAASTSSAELGDLLFSNNTFGHGSFSGCVLVVDPDQQLVIVQVRKQFRHRDNEYWTRFFQVVADAIKESKE